MSIKDEYRILEFANTGMTRGNLVIAEAIRIFRLRSSGCSICTVPITHYP